MEGDSEKEGDPKVAYDTLDYVVNDKGDNKLGLSWAKLSPNWDRNWIYQI